MSQSITLKWGSVKAWNGLGDNAKAMDALRRYHAEPVAFSAAAQHDTSAQTQAVLDLIDAVDGDIWDDWNGRKLTKEEAKTYIQNYLKDV